MNDTIYYISEASKKVEVEPHVLRYWEEELKLSIERNEMGHRCYTGKDIETLRRIKQLKEQGLQLKAIRAFLQGDSGDIFGSGHAREEVEENGMIREEAAENKNPQDKMLEEKVEDMVMKKAKKYMVTMSKGKETVLEMPEEGQALKEYEEPLDDEREKKAKRLQYLLQHMVTDAVKSANREMCTEIKESILKELDYQFRQQEERDEERRRLDEEHYRKIDEMISQRRRPGEKFVRGKKKEPLPPK
ncbi:MAG: helix-turn-helix domain-containing protein [Lachnospiraceae bacterium]|nr:helix-turn-helix domain-containing protein [Lachnospiraceae bacterium]